MSAQFISGFLVPEIKTVRSLEAARQLSDPIYLPLVDRLRQMRQKRGGTLVVGIAGIHRGAGATYVTGRLEKELARQTGDRVCSFAPHLIESGSRTTRVALANPNELEDMTKRADYVLIDCPPVQQSGFAAVVGRHADGMFLVIEAGRTSRTEIQGALTSLSLHSVPVLGLVLNKRKYPIPKAIYRWL